MLTKSMFHYWKKKPEYWLFSGLRLLLIVLSTNIYQNLGLNANLNITILLWAEMINPPHTLWVHIMASGNETKIYFIGIWLEDVKSHRTYQTMGHNLFTIHAHSKIDIWYSNRIMTAEWKWQVNERKTTSYVYDEQVKRQQHVSTKEMLHIIL